MEKKPLWKNCAAYTGKSQDHRGFNGCWSCNTGWKRNSEGTIYIACEDLFVSIVDGGTQTFADHLADVSVAVSSTVRSNMQNGDNG